ncbi:MAG: tetratricopeptide repeat protein [Fimbriimonadaceae bacterium]|nr:tetratricopeptide repeat protein [Alphaproteobacteria bacterium]
MTQNHRVATPKRFYPVLTGGLMAFFLSTALSLGPVLAMGSGDAVVIQPTHDKEKSKAEEDNFSPQQPSFAPGSWQAQYLTAVSMIEADRYEDAFVILASLDQPDNADVLNYMGYTSRKMGRMEDARRYYEAALTINPNHLGVLEYYGEWHVMMGDLDTARRHLAKIAALCGVNCEEYRELADEIAHPGNSDDKEW